MFGNKRRDEQISLTCDRLYELKQRLTKCESIVYRKANGDSVGHLADILMMLLEHLELEVVNTPAYIEVRQKEEGR